MIEIVEYLNANEESPFAQWFERLDAQAAARVTVALTRMEQGNFSDTKGVGAGVFERKLNFGPGYRIYFGKDGDQLVILLAGGTKKRQGNDILAAHQRWEDYKQRKKEGRS